ncbi:hypothetical protein BDW59DRAFT_75514 [Aspergillus cavernicola]|uniref:Uncharacterized protein n=1 Tax=Aspergillus cavernicola TaxID=176166 RepID=A0ABR4ID47_9EURO
MDGSLQVHKYQDVQSPKTSSPQIENRSDSDLSHKFEHDSSRSSGAQPTASDAASCSSGTSVDVQERQRISHGLPEGYPSSDSTAQEGYEDAALKARDMGANELADIPYQKPSGYMRPSTNPPKVNHMLNLDDFGRRRSRSIGSSSRDSRIAALSVQLRTRLSYAAAKIEKKRQSHTSQYQSPIGLLQKNASTPILTAEPSRLGQLISMGELEDQRSVSNSSPDGTTVSAPDAPATSSPYPCEAHMRPSPVSMAHSPYLPSQSNPQKYAGISSSEELALPKLAPPADILPGRVNCQRRRPNLDVPANNSRYTPFPLHGRHRSQQGLQIDPDVVLVLETPPLRPSTLAPYSGLSDNLQSSSMEQDAIETLLFMSSPGTSGYHSNSQNSQRKPDAMNIDISVSNSTQWPGNLDRGQSNSRPSGQADNPATQAGDEMDLILDQMNSDSDDDANYTSSRPGVNGAVGHKTLHEK